MVDFCLNIWKIIQSLAVGNRRLNMVMTRKRNILPSLIKVMIPEIIEKVFSNRMNFFRVIIGEKMPQISSATLISTSIFITCICRFEWTIFYEKTALPEPILGKCGCSFQEALLYKRYATCCFSLISANTLQSIHRSAVGRASSLFRPISIPHASQNP